jgi:hypothetical protein
MFNTPLHYSVLRPIVQVQHLKHEHLRIRSLIGLQENDDPSVNHHHRFHQKKEEVPPAKLHSKVAVQLESSAAKQLKQVSPLQFTIAGAVAGLIYALSEAVKTPLRTKIQDLTLPGGTANELQYYGIWSPTRELPSAGFDLKRFKNNQSIESIQVRRRSEGPLVWWPWTANKRPDIRIRTYDGNRFHDLHATQDREGQRTLTKSIQDRHGTEVIYAATFSPKGCLEEVTHTIGKGKQVLALTPLTPVEPTDMATIKLVHRQSEATTTFELDPVFPRSRQVTVRHQPTDRLFTATAGSHAHGKKRTHHC